MVSVLLGLDPLDSRRTVVCLRLSEAVAKKNGVQKDHFSLLAVSLSIHEF